MKFPNLEFNHNSFKKYTLRLFIRNLNREGLAIPLSEYHIEYIMTLKLQVDFFHPQRNDSPNSK